MNRKQERKLEKKAESDKEDELRRAEECRKEALSMYMRIEEADCSDDVKDILHRITNFLVLE